MELNIKDNYRLKGKAKGFDGIYINDFDFKKKKALELIKKQINDKNYTKIIPTEHLHFIEKIKKDLFESEDKDRFSLSKSFIDEFEIAPENKKLIYLIHRYRYEIYPKLKLIDSYPPLLQIEPTSFCNFRCVFCFQKNKTFTGKSNGFMGHMSLEMFKDVIDQIQNNIQFINIASRGEPMMSKNIIKMLEYTEGKFLGAKVNTNASLLNEKKIHSILSSGVTTLVFSADAADEKLYSELRVNGNLNSIIKNIENFNKIKESHYKNKKIITRVSGVKVNDSQDFDKMKKVWASLVDHVAFVKHIPWEDIYSSKENNIKSPCSDLWRKMYVWWDGIVNPCEIDFKSTLRVGKFPENKINEIWRSKEFDEMRDLHLKSERSKLKPCNKCSVI